MSNLALAASLRVAGKQSLQGLSCVTSDVAVEKSSAAPVRQKTVADMPFNARAGDFLVLSSEELEVDKKLQLVKGNNLTVIDSTGMVIHTNVRGILPAGRKSHLVRGNDGYWRVFENTGKGKRYLQKVNVSIGENMLFFDEHGKMRLNSWNPHYGETLRF